MVNISKRSKTLCLLFIMCTCLAAQTPVANRVRVAARHLPQGATVLAKYTDNQRHCLYYIQGEKIFCLDVVLNINEELDFNQRTFKKVVSTSISNGGDYMFVVLDRGENTGWALEQRYELWRIDSKNRHFTPLGQGFKIEKTKEGYVLSQTVKCLNPRAPRTQQRWMVREQDYDEKGKPLPPQKPYEMK